MSDLSPFGFPGVAPGIRDNLVFIYRCLLRKYNAQITIDKNNLLKILSNEDNKMIVDIEVKYEKARTPVKKGNISIVNKIYASRVEHNLQLGLELKKNLSNPLQFHINNIKDNNIFIFKFIIKFF